MKKYFLVLIGLLAIGAFLRFYQLGAAPYWMDEGYTINAVLSIEETGRSVLDSGRAYHCPLYCFPTAWTAEVFGDAAFSYRLLAALAGITLILIIANVTKRFFGSTISLIAGVAMTFSTLQIAWSRQARWYTLCAVFFWLAIYFFYKLLYDVKQTRAHRIQMIFGMVVSTILACLTHGVAYILPIIFLVWYIVDLLFIQKRFAWKKIVLPFLSSIGGMIILDRVFHLGLLARLIDHIALYNDFLYYSSFLWRNYWLFIIFAVVALVTPKAKNRAARFFLLFVFLAYLLPLSYLTNIVHYRYLFYATPALLVLGVVGMHDIYSLFKKTWAQVLFVLILLATFFTIGDGTIIPKTFYLLESDNPETLPFRDYYAYTPQPNWNAAYDFIKTNQTENDIVISSMPQFNKIFLHTPGYWIKYNYTGSTSVENLIRDNKEFYVNAEVVNDLDELKALTATHHGYIIFDYMAFNGKIPSEITEYISSVFTEVFEEKTNFYSEVWVFQF